MKLIWYLVLPFFCLIWPKSIMIAADITKCYIDPHSPLHAICSNKEIVEVPQYLPENLQEMNLDQLVISELCEDSFSRYTKLETLTFVSLTVKNAHPKTLLPLDNLKLLNLRLSEIPLIQLPTSLDQLVLDNTDTIWLDAITKDEDSYKLNNLKGISLRHYPKKTFPRGLAKFPTLTKIILSGSEIEYITAEDLAPLCNLKDLVLFNMKYLFKKKEHTCKCVAVREWVAQRSMKLEGANIECLKSQNNDKYGCDVGPALASANATLNQCFKIFETSGNLKKAAWVGGIISILLVIGVFVLCWRNFRRRQHQKNAYARDARPKEDLNHKEEGSANSCV